MILKKLREILKQNKLDYLLINTTDEFLVEYNELSNCARYFVTGFSGSTGDVLLSQKTVYQFVDGRYHEQADNEVDHKTTQVVKLQIGQSFLNELVEKIENGTSIGIVSKKISLNFYKILKLKLSKKHCKIVTLDYDPVSTIQQLKGSDSNEKIKQISIDIARVSADEKFKKISKKLKKDDAYFDSNLENVAYLTNCRQYKTPFSSTFKAKTVDPDINLIISPILRAGLIFTDEAIDILPQACIRHIGMYRDEKTLKPVWYYNKVPMEAPNPEKFYIYITDPMLATGNSLIEAIKLYADKGIPIDNIKVICIIAAPQGIENIQKHYPDIEIITAAVDDHLNEKGYIVPGMGDAGDRIFNT